LFVIDTALLFVAGIFLLHLCYNIEMFCSYLKDGDSVMGKSSSRSSNNLIHVYYTRASALAAHVSIELLLQRCMMLHRLLLVVPCVYYKIIGPKRLYILYRV
jgi:hypothetical protein